MNSMIVASLMAATLGALAVEAADAQLFARMRARANLRSGGPGIFGGGGIFDGGGVFDRYPASGVIDGGGVFDGGGVVDRFDQNYSASYPSSHFPADGYTTSAYANNSFGYSSPVFATNPSNTVAGQYQNGVVVSSEYPQANRAIAITAAPSAIITNNSSQSSINQSSIVVYGAPIADSQIKSQKSAKDSETSLASANQQPGRTETGGESGQDPASDNLSSQVQRMNAADEAQAMIQFFAAKLVLCNNDGIHAAGYAAEKANSPQVKSFAEMLVKDHQELNQRLAKFVPAYSDKPMTGNDAWSVAPDAKSPETKTSASSLATSDSTFSRLYDVCRKASEFKQEQCEKMMSDYSAEELDMAFTGSQILSHQMLLAELKALESSTSGEFQFLVREAKSGIESHLDTAMKLAEELSRPKE